MSLTPVQMSGLLGKPNYIWCSLALGTCSSALVRYTYRILSPVKLVKKELMCEGSVFSLVKC